MIITSYYYYYYYYRSFHLPIIWAAALAAKTMSSKLFPSSAKLPAICINLQKINNGSQVWESWMLISPWSGHAKVMHKQPEGVQILKIRLLEMSPWNATSCTLRPSWTIERLSYTLLSTLNSLKSIFGLATIMFVAAWGLEGMWQDFMLQSSPPSVDTHIGPFKGGGGGGGGGVIHVLSLNFKAWYV